MPREKGEACVAGLRAAKPGPDGAASPDFAPLNPGYASGRCIQLTTGIAGNTQPSPATT